MEKYVKNKVYTKGQIQNLVESNTLRGEENVNYYKTKGEQYLNKLINIRDNVYNKIKNISVFEAMGEIEQLRELKENLDTMDNRTENFNKELYNFIEDFDLFDRSDAISDLEYNLINKIEDVTYNINALSYAVEGIITAAEEISKLNLDS